MAQYTCPHFIVDAVGNLPTTGVEGVLAYSQNENSFYVWTGAAWVLFASGTAIDSDKGDITVSSSGTVYTIDNNVVTYAKMQDITATQRVIGRNTAGSGDPEEVTASQVLDWRATTRGSLLYRGASTWDGLSPSATSGQVVTSNGTGADPSYADPGGYVLTVVAATAATLTDGQTLYFGGHAGTAPSTTEAAQVIYIPKTGTITAAYIFGRAGTAGSNESWTLYIRYNATTDTAIQALSASTASRTWSNTALSIAVTQGSFIEIKSVNPTWGTNPANMSWGGQIYVR